MGPWVHELRSSCGEALAGRTRLVLDLEHVRFVDRHGVELLRGLMKAGVVMLNCSPFVHSQLGT